MEISAHFRNDLRESLHICRGRVHVLDARPEKVPTIHHGVGHKGPSTPLEAILGRGQVSEADSLLSLVLQGEEKVRPHPHPRLGLALTLLAEIRIAQNRAVEARDALQRALVEFSMLPMDHPARQRAQEYLRVVAESSIPIS